MPRITALLKPKVSLYGDNVYLQGEIAGDFSYNYTRARWRIFREKGSINLIHAIKIRHIPQENICFNKDD
jgi:hypothetical protein